MGELTAVNERGNRVNFSSFFLYLFFYPQAGATGGSHCGILGTEEAGGGGGEGAEPASAQAAPDCGWAEAKKRKLVFPR